MSSSPTVEEGLLPGLEFVGPGRDCVSKLYELAAERDFTQEQDKGIQPGEKAEHTHHQLLCPPLQHTEDKHLHRIH